MNTERKENEGPASAVQKQAIDMDRKRVVFQHRHYEELARVLGSMKRWDRIDGKAIGILADFFEEDNPKFDREKFFMRIEKWVRHFNDGEML